MTYKANILFIEDINEDQEEEIKELLSLQNLKGSDVYNNVTYYLYLIFKI